MDILESFKRLSLTPVIGAEIEFYLDQPKLVELIIYECKKATTLFFRIEKEKGLSQYEIQTNPTTNILLLTEEIFIIKKTICKIAQQHASSADFSAKPFLDQPGNALHVHINLIGNDGTNLFESKDYLLWAISGLCRFMRSSMLIFAPHVKCYHRYQYPDKNTPTAISWGHDNRTTALRVIFNRIEHRVPCVDSDVEAVINEILKAVLYGVVNKGKTINPIYGVASDAQYKLEQLPMTFSEAKRCYNNKSLT